MNPELLRQSWLEINVARAATLALSLAALFALAALLDERGGLHVVLPSSAMIAFIAVTIAWGGHRAGEALMDELRARTWDLQRLSALSPWSMVWGKWLGATSLAWLGGGFSLAVFAVSAHDFAPLTRVYWVLQAVGGALLVQGMSLLAALAIATHPRRLKGPLGSRLFAAGVGAGYALLMFKLIESPMLTWYGHQYNSLALCTVLLWIAVVWVTIGCWRAMREDLQLTSVPWAWLAFLATASVVMAGWYAQPSQAVLTQGRLLLAVALAVCLVAAYLAAFSLYRDPLVARRVTARSRARAWRRCFSELPLWLVALGLGLVIALICVLLRDGRIDARSPLEDLGFSALALWLFAARDLLLLVGLSLHARPERAELTALIYLGLLYWLLPRLLDFAGLDLLATALRPALWQESGWALLALTLQLVLVCGWAWFSFRARVRPPATTSLAAQ